MWRSDYLRIRTLRFKPTSEKDRPSPTFLSKSRATIRTDIPCPVGSETGDLESPLQSIGESSTSRKKDPNTPSKEEYEG